MLVEQLFNPNYGYELAIYTSTFVKCLSLQNIFLKNIVNRLLISCTSDTTFKMFSISWFFWISPTFLHASYIGNKKELLPKTLFYILISLLFIKISCSKQYYYFCLLS